MGWLSQKDRQRAEAVLDSCFGLRRGKPQGHTLSKISLKKARELLLRDKKKASGALRDVNFIGVKGPGRPTEGRISVENLLEWAGEEGYLR
jgi:3-dehydroquinate synthetase